MTELRALMRENELRGYSKLRKAELIAFLQDNENWICRQPQQLQQPVLSGGPLGGPQQHQQPQLLTKRQRKCRRAKDTKLSKCFVNLNSEINTLNCKRRS